MEYGLPDESNEWSRAGQLKHEAVYNEEVYSALDDSDRDHVDQAKRSINLFKDQFGTPRSEMFEHFMQLRDFETLEILTQGTCDYVALYPDFATIYDFKFGYYPVKEAAENIQLAAYALMVMQDFGVENVFAAICQPTLNTVSCYNFCRYGRLLANIKRIIAAAQSSKAELNPSSDGCRYCKANAFCPSLRKATDSGVEEFERLSGENGIIADDRLADLLAQSRTWKAVNAKLEKMAKARSIELMKSNQSLPGFRLQKRQGRRVCEDYPNLRYQLGELLSDEELDNLSSIDIVKAEKVWCDRKISSVAGNLTKTEAKDEFDHIAQQYVKRTKDSYSLVTDG